jgi:DNA (cytosine-5)-methyltransferase 1
MAEARWSVVDLFSGGGGASYGFASHAAFELVGAADFELGKPSSGPGALECNATYEANLGIRPVNIDLGQVAAAALPEILGVGPGIDVLIACPPCTGFSRTNAQNHVRDDPRNSLVRRVADFVRELQPSVLVLENARELLMGRYREHANALIHDLESQGYDTSAEIHTLTRFGLPQIRERALMIAAKRPLQPRSLSHLWGSYGVNEKATHVRRALWDLPAVAAGEDHPDDAMHVSPRLGPVAARRMAAIPPDGGSWRQLLENPHSSALMTDGMKRLAAKGDFGSFPDVYGRLWWDRPAATVKRECSHVGNGRYSHPEQNRLCTVRELGILQGFPDDYLFLGSLSNKYRHIGDAVPPLISRQLAAVCEWILTGRRPALETALLPRTHVEPADLVKRRDTRDQTLW